MAAWLIALCTLRSLAPKVGHSLDRWDLQEEDNTGEKKSKISYSKTPPPPLDLLLMETKS